VNWLIAAIPVAAVVALVLIQPRLTRYLLNRDGR
jgi:hypothetical protein